MQRIAVFLGFIVVVAGLAWVLIPFRAGGMSCSLPTVETERDRTITATTTTRPFGEGYSEIPAQRRFTSTCASEGRRRTITGGTITRAGVIVALAGLALLRDAKPHDATTWLAWFDQLPWYLQIIVFVFIAPPIIIWIWAWVRSE
jgi:hypothetical protein